MGNDLSAEILERIGIEKPEERTERLTLLQKIDTAIIMRRKGKTEFTEATGITRRKIDRCDAGRCTLTCEEVWKIARYFDARPQLALRIPDAGVIRRTLASESGGIGVAYREMGECLGIECELEFVLEDIGYVI